MIKKISNKIFRELYKALFTRRKLIEMKSSGDEDLKRFALIVEECLSNKLSESEKANRDRIESLRNHLINEDNRLPADNTPDTKSTDSVRYLAKVASKKEKWAVFLMKLASGFKLKRGLEFGTCIGISAAYQASAMSINDGKLITMEGLKPRKELAEDNFKVLGIENIETHFGAFNEILPGVLNTNSEFDYLFIDGDHRYSATVENFKKVLPKLKDRSIVIVDDIKWSEGMKKAWKEIKNHEQVIYSIDLFLVGICIIGDSEIKKEFKIAMW